MDNITSISKRQRSTNFTNSDKSRLIEIVASYKDIIENKKTDAVSSKQKLELWKIIAKKFNSSGASCPRDFKCLRRMYENRKKLLRKNIALRKRNLYKTGGGLPDENPPELDAADELLLTIVSSKTVQGLDNPFDGDSKTNPITLLSILAKPENILIQDNSNLEVEFDLDDDEIPESSDISNLLPDVNTDDQGMDYELIGKMDESENIAYCAGSNENVKSGKSTEVVNTNLGAVDTEVNLGPDTRMKNYGKYINKGKNECFHKRRPRTIIKTLPSSELAEKYAKLLSERLEIASLQKELMKNKILSDKTEHQLNMEYIKESNKLKI